MKTILVRRDGGSSETLKVKNQYFIWISKGIGDHDYIEG
jgi:hypothetical protein